MVESLSAVGDQSKVSRMDRENVTVLENELKQAHSKI